jgi:hypothetical protein
VRRELTGYIVVHGPPWVRRELTGYIVVHGPPWVRRELTGYIVVHGLSSLLHQVRIASGQLMCAVCHVCRRGPSLHGRAVRDREGTLG